MGVEWQVDEPNIYTLHPMVNKHHMDPVIVSGKTKKDGRVHFNFLPSEGLPNNINKNTLNFVR